MSSRIAIIGGGPSGLALARLLQLHNVDFVVYERTYADDEEKQGGSLDLHELTGQAAMKQCGLAEEFEKYARRDGSAVVLFDKTGTKLLDFGSEMDAPEIDRAHLRRLLANAVQADKIHWGKVVTAVSKDDSGDIVIWFADGSTASGFGLVVGADGTWSQVRHLLTSAKPTYSGKYYLESRISVANPSHGAVKAMVGPGTLIAVGSSKHLAVMCMSDGSYRIYVGLSVSEDYYSGNNTEAVDLSEADGAVARNYFVSSQDYYGDWAQVFKDIILHCEGPFRRWPLYHMPVEALNWEHVPGVTLLGDAAHVSTPFVGEGANCALFDSLQLAKYIVENGTSENDLSCAVAQYEKDMFERGKKLIEKSSGSADLLFADDPMKLLAAIHGNMKE